MTLIQFKAILNYFSFFYILSQYLYNIKYIFCQHQARTLTHTLALTNTHLFAVSHI